MKECFTKYLETQKKLVVMNNLINEEELLTKFMNLKEEEEIKKAFEITTLLPLEE